MNMRKLITTAFALLCVFLVFATTTPLLGNPLPSWFPNPLPTPMPKQYVDYVNQYNSLAISEMNRSGMPASIILAQGLLESGAGTGTIALEANNHFGIKCHNSWGGDCFAKEDDDYDADGQLVKSPFRVYASVEESYIDHTNFLLQNIRYERLFYIDKRDYIGWAFGLQACGYATDPKYAQSLITLVEKYNLYQYDGSNTPRRRLVEMGPMEPAMPIVPERFLKTPAPVASKVTPEPVHKVKIATEPEVKPYIAERVEVKSSETLFMQEEEGTTAPQERLVVTRRPNARPTVETPTKPTNSGDNYYKIGSGNGMKKLENVMGQIGNTLEKPLQQLDKKVREVRETYRSKGDDGPQEGDFLWKEEDKK
jgi:hypothetical protein